MSDIHRSLVQIRLEGMFLGITFALESQHYQLFKAVLPYLFLDSLVVRISACHVEGPGSIPGRGE